MANTGISTDSTQNTTKKKKNCYSSKRILKKPNHFNVLLSFNYLNPFRKKLRNPKGFISLLRNKKFKYIYIYIYIYITKPQSENKEPVMFIDK